MELNTVRVFVNDIDIARHFYSSKLGLPLKADGSSMVTVSSKLGTQNW
jgi:catechol 2,3-dioxygenase-like lactoylglutathione lyase family enzyme